MKKKTAAIKKSPAQKKANNKKPYLTKEILVSRAKKGFREAAEEAMNTMGYTVIAKNGWVVKKFADGTIEKISPIEQVKTSFTLD